ncbi:hypothetical protein B0J15DRAFT_476492 [Fusarium solani]|uniref:Uncharacterized protein n=1 Tax=Fusarium solani TaxID=169388 RepID=A0A9P9L8A3_FUSSL|nr:uncharacterized protein B0J15DRAFT_476492 [Fusarium solani]KAH7276061.1 hypothetical protein B0J15DRAFT_476492 [Fusarium solani]
MHNMAEMSPTEEYLLSTQTSPRPERTWLTIWGQFCHGLTISPSRIFQGSCNKKKCLVEILKLVSSPKHLYSPNSVHNSNIQFQSNHTVVLMRFNLLCLTTAAAAAAITTTTTASSSTISSGASAPITSSRVSAVVAPDVGCSVVVMMVAAAGAATAVLLLVCHGGLCRVVVACGDLLLSEEWKTHCCGFALLADDVLVCCVLCVVCCFALWAMVVFVCFVCRSSGRVKGV